LRVPAEDGERVAISAYQNRITRWFCCSFIVTQSMISQFSNTCMSQEESCAFRAQRGGRMHEAS
jgi:hypothetical protein